MLDANTPIGRVKSTRWREVVIVSDLDAEEQALLQAAAAFSDVLDGHRDYKDAIDGLAVAVRAFSLKVKETGEADPRFKKWLDGHSADCARVRRGLACTCKVKGAEK